MCVLLRNDLCFQLFREYVKLIEQCPATNGTSTPSEPAEAPAAAAAAATAQPNGASNNPALPAPATQPAATPVS